MLRFMNHALPSRHAYRGAGALSALIFLLACTDPQGGGSGPDPAVFAPAAPVMPRLTALQYRNALRDIFGGALPATALEPDTNPYLFYSIGASTTALSELGTQQYAEAATVISDALFADAARRKALLGCAPAKPDDACASDFVKRVGRALFRRPLPAADVERWLTVARTTADGDAYRGLRYALAGMLQSPRFLYRIEVGAPDPADSSAQPRRRYDAYEMAQRLSFFLWNTTPDEELLAAAGRGELLDDESLRTQAARLLAAPRAHAAVQSFFEQYLNLGGLSKLERDPARFPAYSKTLGTSMRSEVSLLVEDLVFHRDVDIRELFSSPRTFVNTELAALYQLQAPGATEVAFVPVELPAGGPRVGLLTLGAFLVANAHPTETSPTLRGKYLRERILCQLVPPPPGNINLNLDETGMKPRTVRERLEEHRRNPACAGCHKIMDPPGLLFETFDAIGAYRATVNDQPVQTEGEIDGVTYADARALAQRLRADPLVAQCLVKQVYRHANGRLDQPGDERALADLTQRFAASGHRFRELLLALVQSEGFRTAAPAEVMP